MGRGRQLLIKFDFSFSQMAIENRLKPTWDWVLTVMDATEAQLRFGASLTRTTDPSHPLHPLHLNTATSQTAPAASLSGINVLGGSSQSRTRLIDTSSSGSSNTTRIVGFSANSDNQRNFDRDNAQSSRREFLTYALSLMRSHSSEHRDSLPVLDITALRHIAYVVDGIVYYMRSGNDFDLIFPLFLPFDLWSNNLSTGTDSDKSDISYWTDADENENDDSEFEIQMNCDNESTDDELSTVSGSRHTFFQRSESTLCLGCPPPDPFNLPMNEALPLADQPHLLHPNANREDLFGIPKQPDTIRTSTEPRGTFSPLELPPTRLGMSSGSRLPANPSFDSTTGTENADETIQQDDQTISIEIEEKSEKKQEPIESKSVTAANQNSPVPSTSKQTPTRQAPEGFNIYMQLKKKTYLDFYENEKRDAPQDLSCTKSSPETKRIKFELDSDVEMSDTDADAHQQSQSSGGSGESSGSATVRPQIIVSPRKLSAFAKTVKSDQKESTGESSNFNLSSNDTSASAQVLAGDGTSGSPSKSVIVRAGPSSSLVSF